MNSYLPLCAAFLFSFAVGSIPIGYVIARLQGIDIRKHGSGNIGATNIKRTLGTTAGAMTLALDFLKGVIAIQVTELFVHGELSYLTPFAGFLAITGHCFSPFLNFKGGKGVATGLGVFFCLAPVPALAGVLFFIFTLKLWKMVALGSLLSAVAICLLIILGFPSAYTTPTLLSCLGTTGLIFLRHASNIRRMVEGKERTTSKP